MENNYRYVGYGGRNFIIALTSNGAKVKLYIFLYIEVLLINLLYL